MNIVVTGHVDAEGNMSGKAKPLRTVGELIDVLSEYDRDASVMGTWEGIMMGLCVYPDKDGLVLVDADEGAYQARHQDLRCTKCGHIESYNFADNDKPVCFKCLHAKDDN